MGYPVFSVGDQQIAREIEKKSPAALRPNQHAVAPHRREGVAEVGKRRGNRIGIGDEQVAIQIKQVGGPGVVVAEVLERRPDQHAIIAHCRHRAPKYIQAGRRRVGKGSHQATAEVEQVGRAGIGGPEVVIRSAHQHAIRAHHGHCRAELAIGRGGGWWKNCQQFARQIIEVSDSRVAAQ